DCIEVIGDGTLKVYWNKYRVLGLLQLNGIEQPDEREDEFISVVSYNGCIALKDKVAEQKEQILEYVANEPRATYPKIAKAIGATKAEVAARLRYLFRDGLLARDENGDFLVLKK
ncbi:MAG: AsnC family protein, partial [Oscillospiraceae bacterium]